MGVKTGEPEVDASAYLILCHANIYITYKWTQGQPQKTTQIRQI